MARPSKCAVRSQVAPSLAINYCAYETLRSYWLSFQPDLKAPTVAMSLLCGSFAGLISSTATFPLDLARRRLQLEGQVRTCCGSDSPLSENDFSGLITTICVV